MPVDQERTSSSSGLGESDVPLSCLGAESKGSSELDPAPNTVPELLDFLDIQPCT